MKGINAAGMKSFFMNHGEKIVFGLVLLALAWGVYSLVGHETYEKTPESLITLASSAESHVGQSKVPTDEIIWDPPTQRVREGNDPIPADPYQLSSPFFRPPWRIGGKRPEPVLLAILEPEISASVGPLAFLADGNEGEPVARAKAGAGAVRPQVAAPGAAGRGRGRAPGGGPAMPGGAAGPGVPGGVGGAGRPGGRGPAARPPRGAAPPTNLDGAGAPASRGAGSFQGSNRKDGPGVDAPSDSLVRGKHWVLITAVVPLKEQAAEYVKAFSNARHYDRAADFPRIEGCYVHRQEITGDEAAPDDEWIKLKMTDAYKVVNTWAIIAPEVVDPAVTLGPRVTSPLPPLLGSDWGRSAAHARFPLVGSAGTVDESSQDEDDEAVPSEDEDPFGDNDSDNDSDDAPRRPAAGRPGAATAGAAPGGGAIPKIGAGQRPSGGSMRVSGVLSRSGNEKVASDRLFRFFDFTVEPGKRYRYRVELVFANPNYKLEENLIEKKESAKKQYVTGPVSVETPIVTVPRFSHILAGPAKATQGGIEPSAKIVIEQWEQELGVNAVVELKQNRGQLVDTLPTKTVYVDPATGENATRDITFVTGSLLVDISGGELMPGPPKLRMFEPAELLLLDSDGRLFVRQELIDGEQFIALSTGQADRNGTLRPERGSDDDEEKASDPDGLDFLTNPGGGDSTPGTPRPSPKP